jgi:excisionase family DNA binding protein
LTVLAFDRKKLAQNTLSAISQFGAGEKDVGHDAREYAVGEKTRRADTVLPPSRTVMTLQETADYLRVTRSTIQRLLKHNQIPAFRIGRHWRFNIEEIRPGARPARCTKTPRRMFRQMSGRVHPVPRRMTAVAGARYIHVSGAFAVMDLLPRQFLS